MASILRYRGRNSQFCHPVIFINFVLKCSSICSHRAEGFCVQEVSNELCDEEGIKKTYNKSSCPEQSQ